MSVHKENLRFDLKDFYIPLFESAGEGMLVTDRAGIIIMANSRVQSLFQYTRDELIGQSANILIPGSLRKAHEQHIDTYFKHPKPRLMGESRDLRGEKKDGTTFPIEVSLNYFKSSNDLFAIALITDITQRKLDEQKIIDLNQQLEQKVIDRTDQLSESERLYSTIARNFPDGTINVFDEKLNYIFVEGRELFKLGITSKALIGSNYIDRLPQRVAREVEIKLKKVFNGQPLSFELEIDNSFYQLDAVPLNGLKGYIDRILVIEKNITEKKQIDAEIKKALDREKELNILKSRFVSMASHEFRTPLSTILSSVSLIARYTKENEQANRDKHIARIKSSVNNLTTILNDFLSLDKLEEGKVSTTRQEENIDTICTQIIEEIKALLKPGQVINYTHTGNRFFYLDKHLFGNVLLNLLSNAIKYSGEDTTITLKSSIINNQLLVEVKDQGIGIPKSEKHHMFERFFRAKNAVNIEGTGLGLNIVKKYLDLMGGTISFESEEGKGTSFIIQL